MISKYKYCNSISMEEVGERDKGAQLTVPVDINEASQWLLIAYSIEVIAYMFTIDNRSMQISITRVTYTLTSIDTPTSISLLVVCFIKIYLFYVFNDIC